MQYNGLCECFVFSVWVAVEPWGGASGVYDAWAYEKWCVLLYRGFGIVWCSMLMRFFLCLWLRWIW